MENNIKEICIQKDRSLSFALKRMDEIGRKVLLLTNSENIFFSLISIGDIQRAIIKNLSLDTPVCDVIRKDVTVAYAHDDIEKVKERMKTRRNELMPIIDENNSIIRVIFWEDLFEEKRIASKFDMPVVIMAGGRGARLKPLTNVIPKPLIPINSKTIIEDIMDRFVEHGCNKFYLSVNYKADMINYYFSNLNNPNYKIEYILEEKPLGTAGSLSLLKGRIDKTFFISNCDIIVDEDYSQIVNYHRTNKNDITIVAAIKQYPIPYGTLTTKEDGQLTDLQEKPELTFKINSGVYIMEPHIINFIPENTFLHITTLIEELMNDGYRIGVFPVPESSWKDMGSMSEYRFGK